MLRAIPPATEGAESPESPAESDRSARYDPETRELARQLWGFVHGRNAEAVARAMQAGFPGIEARTIRNWALDEGWAERIAADVRAIAPALREQIVVDLIAGAAEGAAHLRAVVRGEAKAEAPRVNAALGLVDRAGVAAARPGPPLALPGGDGPAPAGPPDDATDEELARYLARRLAEGRGR